nr:hypothetical protein [Sicyoidochytrium minutum DNA virus]
MERLFEQTMIAALMDIASPFKGKRVYVADKPKPDTKEPDDVRGHWMFNWDICLSVQYENMHPGIVFEAMIMGHKDDTPESVIERLHDLFDDLYLPRRTMSFSQVIRLMENVHRISTDTPLSQVNDEWVPLDNDNEDDDDQAQDPGQEEKE